MVHSDWPSVSGWLADNMSRLVPRMEKSCCQKVETNFPSHSDTMDLGIPCKDSVLCRGCVSGGEKVGHFAQSVHNNEGQYVSVEFQEVE